MKFGGLPVFNFIAKLTYSVDVLFLHPSQSSVESQDLSPSQQRVKSIELRTVSDISSNLHHVCQDAVKQEQ